MIFFGIFSKQRRHYKQKSKITQWKIWDLEFMREKLRGMREGIRNEHDRIKEQVEAATLRLAEEKEKEDPDKTIVENLENYIKKAGPDVAQLVEQMKGIDNQIEGENGVNQKIEGLQAVLMLLRDFMKKV